MCRPGADAARAAACAALVALALAACARPDERHPFSCADPKKVVALKDVHYPDETCESATSLAESRLTTGIYRTTCRQLAPADGLPPAAVDAVVRRCEPASERDGFEGGVVAQLEVCCP